MRELEKILEEIDEIKVGFDTECRSECDLYDWSCGACVGECDEYIKERAKDIIRKHMNDGWIPVEERLPEEGTQVIVTTEDGMVYGDIVYGYADETDSDPCFHRWDDEYWQCFKPIVIAWRPLSEPYYLEPEAKKPNWRENMLRKFDRRD